jgi:hypothetical protein
MEIHPVGAMLIHADRERDGQMAGQTDITKVIGTFHDYEMHLKTHLLCAINQRLTMYKKT